MSEIDAIVRLEGIERRYGARVKIPMGHGEPLLQQHARGILDDGRKFVYCPIGFICSWHPGDYDNRWCHWCQIEFGGATE